MTPIGGGVRPSLTLSLKSSPGELLRVREELSEMFKAARVDEKESSSLILAVDELLSSVINYNQETKQPHDLTISFEVNETRFKASLTDSNAETEVTPPYEQFHTDWKYKFSFYLICKIMDQVSFSHRRGVGRRFEVEKSLRPKK